MANNLKNENDLRKLGYTPIKVAVLKKLLVDYPVKNDAHVLKEGFEFGFRINYEGPREVVNCVNLKSAYNFEQVTEEKIFKEVKLGRIAGPFSERPLKNLRLSPIGVVPKNSQSSDFRLIHHLSYPNGKGVNNFIDHDLCTVQYTSFDTVLDKIADLGKNSLLAKMDIRSAFRLLIINPDDFELLGFKFKNQYFFDKNMPFGCSAACALFEKFATFLEWSVRHKYQNGCIEHYLDDFLMAGKSGSRDCEVLMSTFRDICTNLGVPIADDKTIGPTPILVFLGIEIDTTLMVIRLPQQKLLQTKEKLLFIYNQKKVTLKELQSLVGLLNFCAKALPSARAFNRRFCDAMSGVDNKHYFIRVTIDLKEDIIMWIKFLEEFNGTCRFDKNIWLSNKQLNLYTDSAGNAELGAGVYFSGRWAFLQWPSLWRSNEIMRDITFLEFVPIVMAVHMFKSELSLKQIMFHTDNKALVSIINKKSSKSKRVMQLVRHLVIYTMLHDMQVKACHVEGRKNSITDAISRKQWYRFRTLAPEAESSPREIPVEFLQLISELNLTD